MASIKLISALLLFFVASPRAAVAQKHIEKVMINDAAWGEGSIMLPDGSELKGLVRFNDKTGVVSFESGSNSKSFLARNITGFEYYDEAHSKQRIYYSLPFEDPATNVETKLFFEVLRQYKDFAVLSKVDPIGVNVKKKSTYSQAPFWSTPGSTTKFTVTQVETIYFLDASSLLTPYLTIAYKAVDRTLYDRNVVKAHVEDKEILGKVLRNRPEDIKKYARENKLDLEEKEDLLKVMDYFDSVSNPK